MGFQEDMSLCLEIRAKPQGHFFMIILIVSVGGYLCGCLLGLDNGQNDCTVAQINISAAKQLFWDSRDNTAKYHTIPHLAF